MSDPTKVLEQVLDERIRLAGASVTARACITALKAAGYVMVSIFHGADKAMTDDQLCDQLSADELIRLSQVGWQKQVDRRADRLMALARAIDSIGDGVKQ